MSTIYIAGPMSGLPEYNHPAFHAAEERLVRAGWTVKNPVHTPPPPWLDRHADDPLSWSYYIREAIKLLVECDSICLLSGWEASKGALLELRIALALRMHVFISGDDHFSMIPSSQVQEVLDAHG